MEVLLAVRLLASKVHLEAHPVAQVQAKKARTAVQVPAAMEAHLVAPAPAQAADLTRTPMAVARMRTLVHRTKGKAVP